LAWSGVGGSSYIPPDEPVGIQRKEQLCYDDEDNEEKEEEGGRRQGHTPALLAPTEPEDTAESFSRSSRGMPRAFTYDTTMVSDRRLLLLLLLLLPVILLRPLAFVTAATPTLISTSTTPFNPITTTTSI